MVERTAERRFDVRDLIALSEEYGGLDGVGTCAPGFCTTCAATSEMWSAAVVCRQITRGGRVGPVQIDAAQTQLYAIDHGDNCAGAFRTAAARLDRDQPTDGFRTDEAGDA